MYIQNQTFKDEETLLEQLFDFSLGEAEPAISEMMNAIDQEVMANETYQQYKATIKDEEELMELEEEERSIRLAERLMEMYDSFEVAKNHLYGIKNDEKKLLYSIDLY